jgi:hypothetical protein
VERYFFLIKSENSEGNDSQAMVKAGYEKFIWREGRTKTIGTP